ncbi:MAG TPA: S49 family peptidase, partial [Candidatus Ozemobacteraceae bacterium]|nr:S49 family peptidase [Candidatus Ozemobacteraceae bacterium]
MRRFFRPFVLQFLALLVFTTTAPAAGLFDLFGGMSGQTDSAVAVQYVEGDKSADDEILVIKVKGLIYERGADDSDSMPWDMKKDMIETLRKDVKAALDRAAVKAILLEIDSPGGEVTATDIIHHELLKIREAKKPMVALIGTMAASGGYYVACAADWIIAHPTSIIGSIGVLMRAMNLEKLAAMIGYK